MSKNKLLDNLNKEQLQAVKHKNGPMLVIAGAGTGKTKVITTRIAYLIQQKLAKPEEILALTFTEKAASEMEERVDILVPYGYVNTQISTFHAFGQAILTEFAFDLGLNSDFKMLTEDDQAIFVNEHLFSFDLKYFRPSSNPHKYVRPMLKFFSRAKDELLKPDDIINYAKQTLKTVNSPEDRINTEKYLELGNAFKTYQDLLSANDLMDYGDQINQVVHLLKNHPDIRKKLQNRFRYILVDEFQDTNYAQNVMVELLTGKEKNIAVVGDDDQSIYRFRGASISNIMNFTNKYKNTKLIVLNKNYRSTQKILDCTYRLIQHNNPDRLEKQHNIDKKLISLEKGTDPELNIFADHYTEANWIATNIKKTTTKNRSFKDIAIITRSNANYSHIVEALRSEKIPYVTSGSISLLEKEPVQMCVDIIRVLTNPSDNLSIFNILTSKLYSLDVWEMSKISGYAQQKNKNIIYILENINDHLDEIQLLDSSLSIIDNFLSDIKEFSQKARHEQARKFLYDYLSHKKMLGLLIKTTENQQYLIHFFKKVEAFENISINKTIYGFVPYLLTLLDINASFDGLDHYEIDAVNILTAHSAKGLEFDTVYLPVLTSDYFPSRKVSDSITIPEKLIREILPENDFHIQEERRLFYVAATRAKNNLFLSYAQTYGGVRLKKPSTFILESLDINLKNKKIIQGDTNNLLRQIPAQTDIFSFARSKKRKLTLNAHKIDDYLTCPLKYYYVHEIKLPISKNSSVVYGSAIHKAVEYMFKTCIEHKKPTVDDMIDVFKKNWDSEGFVNQEQEKIRFDEGIIALKHFYKQNISLAQYIKNIEEPFGFQFSTTTKITGRYDVIYEKNKTVEIGDFKTSTIESQRQADSRIKNSRQMQMYALSYFMKYKKLPDKLSLIFIGNDFKSELIPSQKTIEKISQDIGSTQKGILANDYSAKSSKFTCSYCAYKTICPKRFKG